MLPYSIVTTTTTLVFIFIHSIYTLDQPRRVTQPPTIIPGLNKDVIYFDKSQKYKPELPCSAIGNDPITFEWTKNGQIMDFKDIKYISNSTNKPRIILMDKHTGRIQITELREDDAGVYQCIAKNEFGTSLSQKIRLTESTTNAFENPQQERVHDVLAANSLKLECNPPKNEPPGFINWLKYQVKGTRRVDFDSRVAMDEDGNLYFANVQKDDENDGRKYVCQVELYNLGVFITGAVSILSVNDEQTKAQFPVELANKPKKDIVGLKGEHVTFQCIFSGNPTPEIRWERKSGGKIDSKRMESDHTKFNIAKVDYSDAGTYECIGTNSVSNARGIRHTFNLKVESKPTWTSKPVKVDAGEDEQAVFECAAEGRPEPIVEWFINGEPITSLGQNRKMMQSDGQLRFTELKRDDAQVVQCKVSNIHGSLWADVALSILAYKPELKVGFEEIKVTEGYKVTLPCEIDGKPNPLIFWKRGNQKMEGKRFRPMPTGNLTILNATMSDKGNWTCFAENKYGKLNSTGSLKVRRKTKIDIKPLPQKIIHGKSATFKCAASTDPEEIDNLEITWLKDGEPVDFSNPRITKNGINEISINGSTSEDTGKYTCVASNKLDKATADATLEVTAPPDPPEDVTFSSCLSDSAIVSWKPGFDNYSPIKNFTVEYNHSYEPDIWTKGATVLHPYTEAKVTLYPHANYTFRVFAMNDYGRSKPSERSIAMCDTNPAIPEKNPSGLRTDRSRPGWLIIKWNPMRPIEHYGDDFRYNLTIRKDGVINRTAIYDWEETKKEIYIGKIYEPYEMHIEAWNEKGKSSDLSMVHIGYTGEGELLTAPSNFELVPTINVTDKEAVFQWDPIDTKPQMVQGEFKGYKIKFWKEGERNTTEKIVEIVRQPEVDTRLKREASKETATVKTLYPNSKLVAEVVARNTHFESEPSNMIEFETEEGVPGRVKVARVVTRGAHHFLIEWEEPEEPNGNLTGYEIGYRKVEGFALSEIVQATKYDDPDRSRAYLGNLEANQEYNIYIRAKTSKGAGEEYDFDAKTANSGPLIVPEMIIDLVGEDFVIVSWNVNTKIDSPAGAYHYVKYREQGMLEWESSEMETIYNWINVSGLEPRTQYEFTVVANTKGLVESQSEIKRITTRGEGMQSATETTLAQTPWFIVMMVLIAVLILFLIVICFIKRSRGEKYNVQEREKLRGNDVENPDKDLYTDFPKSSETDPLAAGSPDSFDNEGDKLPGGSETDSMAEYGDVDPSKFNEDGSFIGQYGSQKPDEKGNQQSAMSTFV
ncbi:Hemicentin 2 [Mactra antiquata]